MPAIDATLLAVNDILNRAVTQPQCPTQHGLGGGDIAAIILGILLSIALSMLIYVHRIWYKIWN